MLCSSIVAVLELVILFSTKIERSNELAVSGTWLRMTLASILLTEALMGD